VRRASVGFLAALLCLQLVGCAGWRGPRASRAVEPAQVAAFELDGRFNLRLPKEALPGRVRWQHEPAFDEMWFYSPVGSAVARLRQDANGALLVTGEGTEYRAGDLRQLAGDVLGWDLPLEHLHYWVRGLPGPGPADQELDSEGRPVRIRQAGWEVAYLDWAPAGVAGLPSKLDVKGERLRMRLVIDDWKVRDADHQ
jgi:outer membrane lipoprotein LolB